MPKIKQLIAGLLVGASVAAGGAATAQDKEIRIGWTAWSDAEAVTRVTKRILEQRMDYEVELVLLDIALQYNGLARGDIDMMLMLWLPNTHADYWAKVKDDVEDLGVLYSGASLGWVVPDYVPKDQVASISDLKKDGIADKMDGKIQGIDPGAGLMRLSKKTVEEYELDDYDLVSSSGAGMTAALKRAITRKDWIVVTGWRPHWMFGAYELRYLEDPKGTLGGEEQIHALARKGLSEDHPEVAKFVSRIDIPLGELETLMYEAEQSSYEEAAQNYVDNNKEKIESWIKGDM